MRAMRGGVWFACVALALIAVSATAALAFGAGDTRLRRHVLRARQRHVLQQRFGARIGDKPTAKRCFVCLNAASAVRLSAFGVTELNGGKTPAKWTAKTLSKALCPAAKQFLARHGSAYTTDTTNFDVDCPLIAAGLVALQSATAPDPRTTTTDVFPAWANADVALCEMLNHCAEAGALVTQPDTQNPNVNVQVLAPAKMQSEWWPTVNPALTGVQTRRQRLIYDALSFRAEFLPSKAQPVDATGVADKKKFARFMAAARSSAAGAIANAELTINFGCQNVRFWLGDDTTKHYRNGYEVVGGGQQWDRMLDSCAPAIPLRQSRFVKESYGMFYAHNHLPRRQAAADQYYTDLSKDKNFDFDTNIIQWLRAVAEARTRPKYAGVNSQGWAVGFNPTAIQTYGKCALHLADKYRLHAATLFPGDAATMGCMTRQYVNHKWYCQSSMRDGASVERVLQQPACWAWKPVTSGYPALPTRDAATLGPEAPKQNGVGWTAVENFEGAALGDRGAMTLRRTQSLADAELESAGFAKGTRGQLQYDPPIMEAFVHAQIRLNAQDVTFVSADFYEVFGTALPLNVNAATAPFLGGTGPGEQLLTFSEQSGVPVKWVWSVPDVPTASVAKAITGDAEMTFVRTRLGLPTAWQTNEPTAVPTTLLGVHTPTAFTNAVSNPHTCGTGECLKKTAFKQLWDRVAQLRATYDAFVLPRGVNKDKPSALEKHCDGSNGKLKLNKLMCQMAWEALKRDAIHAEWQQFKTL